MIIVGFQVLVALPFVAFGGETSVSEYLFRSRFAGGGRNGIGQAEAVMDNVGAQAVSGAQQKVSLFNNNLIKKIKEADPTKPKTNEEVNPPSPGLPEQQGGRRRRRRRRKSTKKRKSRTKRRAKFNLDVSKI